MGDISGGAWRSEVGGTCQNQVQAKMIVRGPIVTVDTESGKLLLTESGNTREVTPFYDGSIVRIGCTTITREAVGYVLAFMDQFEFPLKELPK